MDRILRASAVIALSFCLCALGSNNSIVSIPYELTYLLPNGFFGDLSYSFENGTTTFNGTINSLLSAASKSPFVSYSDDFLALLGPNPQLKLAVERPGVQFAFEAGIWVPSRKEVWFASSEYQEPAYVTAFNLDTNKIGRLNTTPPLINPNGGYLYNGTVYFTSYRSNSTYRGGIFAINPSTLVSTPILNSYFGLEFGYPDDVVVVGRDGAAYVFFTDFDGLQVGDYTNVTRSALPRAVWRFDMQEKVLLPIITRTDIPIPNGIRVSPDGRTLYVTDFGVQAAPSMIQSFADYQSSSPTIYKYTLDENAMPIRRQVFGMVRDGAADGIHVDDKGRVWTAEYSGITVRSPLGKILGSFNSQAYLSSPDASATPTANFALAGDTLVLGAVDRIYTVKLNEMVVSMNGSLVN